MKKKKKKSGLGGLYVMIAVCVVVSVVAALGLMGKLQVYQESNDSYASLQQAALSVNTDPAAPAPGGDTGAAAQQTGGPLRTISPQELAAAKAAADADETDGVFEAVPVIDPNGPVQETVSTGPEDENVVDEALIWMLKNQQEDELITDRPGSLLTPVPQPESTPAPQQAGEPADTEPADTEPTGTETTTDPAGQPLETPPEPTAAPEPVEQSATGETTPAAQTGEPSGSDPAATPAEPTAVPEPTATPEPTPEPTPTVPPYIPNSGISMERAVTVESAKFSVNFDYLTLINEQVVGWLYQEGTPINYPVMRGNNNEYYLNHLFDGTINSSGSVFMDSGNSAAFIDSATYLYGHHSKGGGMFATLSDYLDPAYYEAHPQFLLMTPFADYQVDVFAGMATFVEDEESWRPKTLEKEEDLDAFLELILSQSFINALEDKLPEWGDRMLVLVTCTNIHSNQRYVIYGRMRPIVYESTADAVATTKAAMDEKPTQNGPVTIDGLGTFMYYAQNDDLWRTIRYESSGATNRRKFGDGGCSPTAVATAIVNLCGIEELPRLIGYSNTELGYTFCECSVNRYWCNRTHAQYQLRSPEEFHRYMPLAVANFCCGNNIWEIISRGNNNGTNMRYLDKICAIYGIRVTVIEEVEELVRRLEEEKEDGIKRMAIGCAVGGSPFTRSGHFMVICGTDDKYMYFLDPLRRDTYEEYDRRGYAEILEPGVCRVLLENVENCNLIPFYLLEKVQ